MYLLNKVLAALTIFLCLNFDASAQFGGGGGPSEVARAGDIQSRYETAGLDVLDASVLGDHVDINTGALSFAHIDVSLPGNSSLPVQLGRSLSPLSAGWGNLSTDTLGFGNWDATIPHIRQTFLTENGPQLDRCTGALGGPYQTYGGFQGGDLIYRWQFWNGFQLSMGGKPVALLEHDNSPEFNGQSPRMVSKSGDIITCIANIGGGLGEGFKLTRPDGSTYEFKKRVEYNVQNTSDNFDDRLEVFFVTRIEDVHNNYVNYTYSGNKLTRIEANDGRRIDITWSGGVISQVTANGRQWSYTYASGSLDRVTLPDGTYWDFSATQAITRYPTGNGCLAAYPDITVKHPAGAQATFEFDPVTNGRTNMPIYQTTNQPPNISECTVGYPLSPSAFTTTSVTKKTVTVPSGPTQVWTWAYEQDTGAYQSASQPSPLKTRTVTFPDGHKVKTYINRRFSWEEGNVEKIETLSAGNTVLQTQEFTYALGHEVGDRLFAVGHSQSLSATYQTYQTQVESTLDSATYTTINEFETDPSSSSYAFGSAKKVTETTSTQPGLSRIAEYEYYNYKTPWILVLPKKTTRNGKIFDEHTYNPSTGLRLTSKQFGITTGTYTYNGDGNLVTSVDAISRTTQYGSYKRGTPQSVTLPDSNTMSRVVDDNGWIASHTNPRGYTFGVSYDSMGRMTNFNRPGTWADTSVSFTSLGNGLVQTVTQGNAKSTTTYDGYYRPILVKAEDLTGHSATRYTKTAYDSMGRTNFSSWPSISAAPSAGVNTSYDTLGRVTQTAETVAPFATTSTAYLSGNQVRITDPVGAQTTTTYRAFGSPGTDEAMQVVDATGTTTTMTRDIHGNITNLNQSSGLNGYTVNVDRKFWYDDRFRLCRHRAPEFGDELFAYDNANQLTMSSRGETAGTSCATPSAARRTSFDYDAMGRQTLIDFPAGTHDITKTYDPNGNLKTVLRGFSMWTYHYYDNDLLGNESLLIDGRTYAFAHHYDSTGNYSKMVGVDGRNFDYNPNGFGEPRGLVELNENATYVSSLSYHPNGLPASAAYGKGGVFWTDRHCAASTLRYPGHRRRWHRRRFAPSI